MKLLKCLLKKRVAAVITMTVLTLLQFSVCNAQNSTIDQSIAKNRKGELIIKAKRGATVTVEQVSHEFWFGCALTDQMFNGSASESDVKQYKEKFLENFNSAVTENAVKWGNMERKKGVVNYSTVDAILKWSD